jgi:DNA repair exonuclease SbcCD ATPase subunit
MYLEELHPGA